MKTIIKASLLITLSLIIPSCKSINESGKDTGDKQSSYYLNTSYPLVEFGEFGYALSTNADKEANIWQAPVLTYNFTDGGDRTGISKEVNLLGHPQKLRIKLKSDGPVPDMQINIMAHFMTFYKTIENIEVDEDGIATVEIGLGDMKSWQYSGGENDGGIYYPLRLRNIYFLRDSSIESHTGKIEFLSMELETKIHQSHVVFLLPDRKLDGDKATFTCQMRNLYTKPLNGTLHWTVRDWAGKVVDIGQKEYALEANESKTHEMTVPHEGRRYTSVEYTFVRGPYVSPTVMRAAVNPPKREIGPRLDPESYFGTGLYLYRYRGSKDYDKLEQQAEMGARAGVKWTREEFNWAYMSPEKGSYNWDYYDRMVDITLSKGISIYGLISYWSNWTEPYTEQGIQDYAQYCYDLVSRYKDRIKHWEVWNEPNIFFWTGPKEMYADLLKEAYKAIKKADPDAVVLGGSVCCTDTAFQQMLREQQVEYDILTIHPYRKFMDDQSFIREMKRMAHFARTEDDSLRPVWITEMGWGSNLYGKTAAYRGVSEHKQARLMARCYTNGLASGVVSNVSWYDFRNDGHNQMYQEHNFGITTYELSPKPAYLALMTLTDQLEGYEVKADEVQLKDHIYIFPFRDKKGNECTILQAYQKSRLVEIPTDEGTKAFNLMGEEIPLTAENGTVLITLPKGDPVFVQNPAEGLAGMNKLVEISHTDTLQAGQQGNISISLNKEPGEVNIQVESPQKWEISKIGDKKWAFTAPRFAMADTYMFYVVFTIGAQTFTLPFEVEVIPDENEIYIDPEVKGDCDMNPNE